MTLDKYKLKAKINLFHDRVQPDKEKLPNNNAGDHNINVVE